MRRVLARLSVLWITLLASSGCFTAKYLVQATSGEAELLLTSRSISSVLRDQNTPRKVKRLLRWVPELKAFAISRGLTPTQNYTRYTDLHRPAAVWVVSACSSLAFRTQRWHFPIVGSVPYLGFFDEPSARVFAAELSHEPSLDIDVRQASAYSTLGWFRDPVLSTMLGEGDEALGGLANVVLHESVHATVYVADQSAFDESLASFVGDRLTQEWLAQRIGEGARETVSWAEAEKQYAVRVARLHEAYEKLDELYASSKTDDQKRAEKAVILTALQTELGTRKKLNNATLVGFKIYDTGHEAFEHVFSACGGEWKCFFSAIQSLQPSDFPGPQSETFSPVVEALVGRVNAK